MSAAAGIGCLTHGCGRVAVYRGNCERCYRRLHNRIRRGKTTWAELEKAGLVLPQVRGRDGLLSGQEPADRRVRPERPPQQQWWDR